jgi:hypothetical protein
VAQQMEPAGLLETEVSKQPAQLVDEEPCRPLLRVPVRTTAPSASRSSTCAPLTVRATTFVVPDGTVPSTGVPTAGGRVISLLLPAAE